MTTYHRIDQPLMFFLNALGVIIVLITCDYILNQLFKRINKMQE